jgi:RNA polymerase sigma-70 factor (ECF subfamily)
MSALGEWCGEAKGLDDAVLIQQTLAGDPGAFATLIRRYQGLVFKVVGGFLPNDADVEEVAQEVFLKVFGALPTFRRAAPFAPWLIRIATRASYDRLRRRRRSREVAWEDLPAAEQYAALEMAGGSAPVDRTAARELAQRALSRLSPKDRQVLILADGYDFSTAEVAQRMGCSSLAVRIRLHRARRGLRKVVESLLAVGQDRT